MFNQRICTYDDIEQFTTEPIEAGLLVDMLLKGDIDKIIIDGTVYKRNDAFELNKLIYENRR